MPTYDYSCDGCGKPHSHFLPMKERNEPPACDSCGHEGMTRVITGTNFQLKGSGWYETDFKNK